MRCSCFLLCSTHTTAHLLRELHASKQYTSFCQLSGAVKHTVLLTQHFAVECLLVLPMWLQLFLSAFFRCPLLKALRAAATCLHKAHRRVCLTGESPAFAQLASVQFHLINTAILFLSREGFRRGCLRTEQDGGPMHVPRLLATAALVLPVGAVTAAATCGLMLRRHGPAELGDPYPVAVYMQGAGRQLHTGVLQALHLPPPSAASRLPARLRLRFSRWPQGSLPGRETSGNRQRSDDAAGHAPLHMHAPLPLHMTHRRPCAPLAGAAALLELAAEPLYILGAAQLRFRLRVGAEAAATLARGALTLALLARRACEPAIALSWGQVCRTLQG